eukprot:scaffold2475_cov115-Isochrysis_galbana.AAC.2
MRGSMPSSSRPRSTPKWYTPQIAPPVSTLWVCEEVCAWTGAAWIETAGREAGWRAGWRPRSVTGRGESAEVGTRVGWVGVSPKPVGRARKLCRGRRGMRRTCHVCACACGCGPGQGSTHQRGPPPVGDVRIKEGACPQRLCGSTGGERRQRAHALAQLTDKVLEQQLGAGPRLAVQGLLVDPAHVGLERVVQHTHHPGRVSRPPRGGQLVLQRLDVPPVVLIRPRLVSPGLPPLGAVQRLGALPPLGVRRVPPEHRPLPPHPKRAPFHEAEQ